MDLHRTPRPGGRARPPHRPAGRPRVALYSHDTMGIGHTCRNLLIARTLAAPPVSATVLLIAGTREAGAFPLPSGIDCLTLPALHKTPGGAYRPRALELRLDELVAVRARTIEAALRAFAPDVLVVDKEPRGAVQEMEPALRTLRAAGRTRCVLGLRDVLDDPATVRREWAAARNEDAIEAFYDAVWVYGDPAVYDLAREYGLRPGVRGKVAYTGYLDPRPRLPSAGAADRSGLAELGVPAGPYALCMVGGGQDGARVAEAFAAADLPEGTSGVIVSGPFMPRDRRDAVRAQASARPGVRVLDFVPDPGLLLRHAARVVTMGGYNTTCEILVFEKPALLVPRVAPRREQMIRAERLRELGLLDVVHPDQVSPGVIGRWLARPAARPRVRGRIDMGGASRLPGLLGSVASAPAAARAGTFS